MHPPRWFSSAMDYKEAAAMAVAFGVAATLAVRAVIHDIGGWPLWLQIPFLVAVFIFLALAAAQAWGAIKWFLAPFFLNVRHRWGGKWAAEELVPVVSFNPAMLITRLAGIDIKGLWDVEPYVVVELQVRNTSGLGVAISGAEGHLRIGGRQCNLPVELTQGAVLLVDRSSWFECRVKQPLGESSAELARHALFPDSGELFIGLDGLTWAGQSPDGKPFQAYLEIGDFTVRGPIRDEHKAPIKEVAAFRPSFGSQHFWRASGERKKEVTP